MTIAYPVVTCRSHRNVFKLTNVPYIEIEMSAPDEKEKRAWLTALQDITGK